MRRGSIIGPLILIGIGVLFLLRNVWPEIPVLEILSRYWPFLLIAWGAIRLIEIFLWAVQSKPIPRNGISGGEWALIILLCVLGGSIHTARQYAGRFPTMRAWHGLVMEMGENYDYPLPSVETQCAKNCRVLIESFRGNARIIGTNEAVVRAGGREAVRSFQQPDADKANKQTPLELIRQGDEIIVRTNQDRVSDRMRVTSDLEITVPADASVEAHGRAGDFDIQNVNGSVDISSDNAGVKLENIGGNARIDLRRSDLVRAVNVKGKVDLKGRGQDLELQNIAGSVTVDGTYAGQIQLKNLAQQFRYQDPRITLRFENLPGQARMGTGEFTANNITGPLVLNGRSRDLRIAGFTQPVELTLERGDIELRPGKNVAKMDVRTRSGDIDLTLPAGAKFDLQASTERGEAHNDYGEPLRVNASNRGATIAGAVDGGPQVRLTTGRGTITVRKSGSEETAFPDFPSLPTSPDRTLKVERQ